MAVGGPACEQTQSGGELSATEPGADADLHVVAGDGMETGHGAEAAAEPGGEGGTSGLGGDDKAGGGGNAGAEKAELGVGKVVEEEIDQKDLGIRQRMFEEIALSPPSFGGPVRGAADEVEGVQILRTAEAGAAEAHGEGAVAGAKFGNAPAGLIVAAEGADDPPMGAHDAVDDAKVAAAVDGGGVVVGKGFEEFGFDDPGGHE